MNTPQISTNKSVVLKGIAWLAGDKVIKLIVSMFTGSLVARYLLPEGYGLLNSVTAYFALFGPLANFGLNSIIMRDIAAHPKKETKIIGSAIVLKAIGSLIAILLAVLLLAPLQTPPEKIMLTLIALSSYLFFPLETIDFWYQAKNKPKRTVIARQTSFLISSAMRVTAIFLNMGIAVIVFTYALEFILGSIILVTFALKDFPNIKEIRFDKTEAKRLFKATLPIMIASIGAILYTKVDKVILPYIASDYTVGIYSAAARLSELWSFIPYSIAIVVAPLIAKAKLKEKKIYNKRIRKSLFLINISTIAIAIIVTIFAPLGVFILFGNDYIESISALRIHIWSLPLVSMGYIQDTWLLNEDLQHLTIPRTFLAAIVNIGLNFLLIPIFGASGVALATLISYTYPTIFANVFNPKTRELFYIQLQALVPNKKNIKLLLEK